MPSTPPLLLCRRTALRRLALAFTSLALSGACAQQVEPEPVPEPAGHWEPVPGVPVPPWSVALLPTGKVLLFQTGTAMALFDPLTRTFGPFPKASTNLFCAGLARLADGRLLAAGGHEGTDARGEFLGLASAEILDPSEPRWSRLPDMAGGPRWYPTALTLADGNVLVASGTHAGKPNPTLEVFDTAHLTWRVVGQRTLPTYPWAAVMPEGDVLLFGPQRPVERLDPQTGRLRAAGQRPAGRSGGMAVVLDGRAGRLLAVGGGAPPSRTAELFDRDAGWQTTSPMALPRHHPHAVPLPDGTLLVLGGHTEEAVGAEGDLLRRGLPLPVEIFDPAGGTWREGARAYYGHGYHGVATLLPDGSVLAAGPLRELEIYRPWYMSARRPRIEQAPATVRLGERFALRTPDRRIERVVAIRLGSATHSLDTDQRVVELAFTAERQGLTVSVPAEPAVAVPGYYLLFIVTGGHVPSEAAMVCLRPNA